MIWIALDRDIGLNEIPDIDLVLSSALPLKRIKIERILLSFDNANDRATIKSVNRL